MSNVSPRTASAVLNRLLVVCRMEERALGRAASGLLGERKARLRVQEARRLTFQDDLCAGILALGGRPRTGRSMSARLSAAWSRVRERLYAVQTENPYAACSRATERTERAYAKALRVALPPDVHVGVERQHTEIEFDRKELRWLRHGGSLGPFPGASVSPSLPEVAKNDERALQTWGEDGGQLATGSGTPAQ
jgi:uncharacterized protein (TIGR02284 family)